MLVVDDEPLGSEGRPDDSGKGRLRRSGSGKWGESDRSDQFKGESLRVPLIAVTSTPDRSVEPSLPLFPL